MSDSEGSGLVCNACGFEEEFIADGMIPCEKCHQVYYCSLECLKWDWEGGDHSNVCSGLHGAGNTNDDEDEEEEASSEEASSEETSGESFHSSVDDDEASPSEDSDISSGIHSEELIDEDEEESDTSTSASLQSPQPAAPVHHDTTDNGDRPGGEKRDRSASPSQSNSHRRKTPEDKPPPHKKPTGGEFHPEQQQPMEWRSVNGKMTLVPKNAPRQPPPPAAVPYRGRLPPANRGGGEDGAIQRHSSGSGRLHRYSEPPPLVPPPPASPPKQPKPQAPPPQYEIVEEEIIEEVIVVEEEIIEEIIVNSDGESIGNSSEFQSDQPAPGSSTNGTGNAPHDEQMHVSLWLHEQDSIVSTLDDDMNWEMDGSGQQQPQRPEQDEPPPLVHPNQIQQQQQQPQRSEPNPAEQGHHSSGRNMSNSMLGDDFDAESEEDADVFFVPQKSPAAPKQAPSIIAEADASAGGAAPYRHSQQLHAHVQQQEQPQSMNESFPAPQKRGLFGRFFARNNNADPPQPQQQQEQQQQQQAVPPPAPAPSPPPPPAPAPPPEAPATKSNFFGWGSRATPTNDTTDPPPHAAPVSPPAPAPAPRPPSPPPREPSPPPMEPPSPPPPETKRQPPQDRPPPQRRNRPSGTGGRKGKLLPTNDLLGPSTFDQRPPSSGRTDNPFKMSLARSYQRSLRHREMMSQSERLAATRADEEYEQQQRQQEAIEEEEEQQPTQNIFTGQCNACEMNADFVSEGLKPCPYCHEVHYCTDDCLQWDWESGGHAQSCRGAELAGDTRFNPATGAGQNSDSDGNMSIEAFEEGQEEVALPGTFMDRVAAAKASVAAQKQLNSQPQPPEKSREPLMCAACGIDAEFVRERSHMPLHGHPVSSATAYNQGSSNAPSCISGKGSSHQEQTQHPCCMPGT
ncbi:unknown protein [Seminavis robusta]|uniref:MYND-type domain-containing protein n=1 Tax=Seminavis robusta TaxID=568900 RepID=A0A9N8DNN0_9STRA|nr:unknown protein [Seminavis robusta]|eukprot:Sro230_g093270.1 n/a (907) ;mRNA; r:22790-25510